MRKQLLSSGVIYLIHCLIGLYWMHMYEDLHCIPFRGGFWPRPFGCMPLQIISWRSEGAEWRSTLCSSKYDRVCLSASPFSISFLSIASVHLPLFCWYLSVRWFWTSNSRQHHEKFQRHGKTGQGWRCTNTWCKEPWTFLRWGRRAISLWVLN